MSKNPASIQLTLNKLAGLFEPKPQCAPSPELSVANQLSDGEIISRAKRSKNGDKFRRLWDGDTTEYGGDDSRADLALCVMLAFWCGHDPARIDSLFRLSSLVRAKWDERRGNQTYGELTIAKALERKNEFAKLEATQIPAVGAGNKPSIMIGTDEYRVNREAIAALPREPNLYQRSGMLVQVVPADKTDSPDVVRRPVGSPVIRELVPPLLRELLTLVANWYRVGKGEGFQSAHPPAWAVSAIHALNQWPGIPTLEAIVPHPVLLPDDTLLGAQGYHAPTGVLVRFPASLQITVRDMPSREDVAAAVTLLEDLVSDFPFASREHLAAWLAGLLTALAWFAFDGPAPWFVIDKNVRGAGAGLLSDVIALILTGRRFPVMSYTPDREELRKRITTLALQGERLVLLDNLAGSVGNDVLDAALTSDQWRDRLLGVNRVYNGPLHIIWFGTGNNVQLQADTARRVCPIRMVTNFERPELRTGFKHPDLRAHVRENRGPLLSAALTILRGWVVAGKPRHGLPAWGSFEGWSGVVREAIVFAGLPDPGATRQALQTASDRDATTMAAMLSALRTMDPDGKGVTTAEILDAVRRSPDSLQAWATELKSAVEELCVRGDARTLGYRFRHFQGRNFGGWMLDKMNPLHGVNRWVVRPVAGI